LNKVWSMSMYRGWTSNLQCRAAEICIEDERVVAAVTENGHAATDMIEHVVRSGPSTTEDRSFSVIVSA